MKKIAIVSASLRGNSNSEILASQFAQGAIEAGHEVEFISLKGKKLAFCTGCMACQKMKKCVISDDANQIADIVSSSDAVVFVTPVYYYSVSGQLKTLIDRMNCLYVRENRFKEAYLLCVAAEDEDHTPDGARKAIQGWVDCFEGVEFVNTFFFGGLDKAGEAKKEELLEEAKECGKSL